MKYKTKLSKNEMQVLCDFISALNSHLKQAETSIKDIALADACYKMYLRFKQKLFQLDMIEYRKEYSVTFSSSELSVMEAITETIRASGAYESMVMTRLITMLDKIKVDYK